MFQNEALALNSIEIEIVRLCESVKPMSAPLESTQGRNMPAMKRPTWKKSVQIVKLNFKWKKFQIVKIELKMELFEV